MISPSGSCWRQAIKEFPRLTLWGNLILTLAQGFIGAACVKQLMKENEEKGSKNRVVVFDVKQDDNILKQVRIVMHPGMALLLLMGHALLSSPRCSLLPNSLRLSASMATSRTLSS